VISDASPVGAPTSDCAAAPLEQHLAWFVQSLFSINIGALTKITFHSSSWASDRTLYKSTASLIRLESRVQAL
jgi:hypothetical protein